MELIHAQIVTQEPTVHHLQNLPSLVQMEVIAQAQDGSLVRDVLLDSNVALNLVHLLPVVLDTTHMKCQQLVLFVQLDTPVQHNTLLLLHALMDG